MLRISLEPFYRLDFLHLVTSAGLILNLQKYLRITFDCFFSKYPHLFFENITVISVYDGIFFKACMKLN